MELNIKLLILGIFIIPTLFIIFYSIEFYFKKLFRTRNEYKNTRGTTHKALLTNGLNNLLNEIQRTKKGLDLAIKAEKNLQKEKDLALEKAASSLLFETEFTKIPGIGKMLKEKVRRTCFDGLVAAWLGEAFFFTRIYGGRCGGFSCGVLCHFLCLL